VKLRSWWFPRYWQFNKWYHGGYQLICLISQSLLIASKRDWYRSKGFFKGFKLVLRPWESSKNWWRYGQMKFVTLAYLYSTPQFPLPSGTCIQKSSLHCKTWVLVLLHSFPCGRQLLVFCFIICHHSHPLLVTEQKMIFTKKH